MLTDILRHYALRYYATCVVFIIAIPLAAVTTACSALVLAGHVQTRASQLFLILAACGTLLVSILLCVRLGLMRRREHQRMDPQFTLLDLFLILCLHWFLLRGVPLEVVRLLPRGPAWAEVISVSAVPTLTLGVWLWLSGDALLAAFKTGCATLWCRARWLLGVLPLALLPLMLRALTEGAAWMLAPIALIIFGLAGYSFHRAERCTSVSGGQ
jgi:hypothetical protein